MLPAMSKHRPKKRQEKARTTHFGYRTVDENEKASLVRDVFDSVAPRYDLMNDLMSLGVHRLWKSAMMDWLAPRPDMRLLDVGGGTGDIAFLFLDRGGGPVTVVDINGEMLKVGRDKALDKGMTDNIEWLEGDAEDLPVADATADVYTTAFCLRNVTRIDRALDEAKRVLKPGGRFMCLEFSQVSLPGGKKVAGDREAYQYLAESIRRFPAQEPFAEMIAGAGLTQVKYRNLSGGIAAIHSAWRT
jgi:demethylmenaquinone methyltransferase/2-methoxy-6-polyprenyl-1,4-benzoquinol methylase